MTIISGCRNSSGIRNYWSSHTPDISDYNVAEEEFARFAELAVQAPEGDAVAAVYQLIKKASRQDEVTYLVYIDLITRGFSLIASPCYAPDLFVHAADRILSGKHLDGYTRAQLLQRRQFCSSNRVGEQVRLPINYPVAKRTLFLVVDHDCSSCRKAMTRLSGEFSDICLVALCNGHGPLPTEPGWDCYLLPYDQDILDTEAGPYYFVAAADGTVETSYKSVYDTL